MLEKTLQNRIRLAISESKLGVLFRNTVGYDKARKVHYGLIKGSCDLIGWKSVKITQKMVGKTVAIFAGIEIKTKSGKLSDAQKNFIEKLTLAGGIAGVVNSEEEMRELLNEY